MPSQSTVSGVITQSNLYTRLWELAKGNPIEIQKGLGKIGQVVRKAYKHEPTPPQIAAQLRRLNYFAGNYQEIGLVLAGATCGIAGMPQVGIRFLSVEEQQAANTALLKAVLHSSDPNTVSICLREGADPNVRIDGRQPLLIHVVAAPTRVPLENIRALILGGADVNARDKDGGTALMEAAFDMKEDVVALLLELGANVNAQDHPGNTALSFAIMRSTDGFTHAQPIVQMLQEARTQAT